MAWAAGDYHALPSHLLAGADDAASPLLAADDVAWCWLGAAESVSRAPRAHACVSAPPFHTRGTTRVLSYTRSRKDGNSASTGGSPAVGVVPQPRRVKRKYYYRKPRVSELSPEELVVVREKNRIQSRRTRHRMKAERDVLEARLRSLDAVNEQLRREARDLRQARRGMLALAQQAIAAAPPPPPPPPPPPLAPSPLPLFAAPIDAAALAAAAAASMPDVVAIVNEVLQQTAPQPFALDACSGYDLLAQLDAMRPSCGVAFRC